MGNINYLTEEGLQKIKEELEDLKNVKRPEVVKKIDAARQFGDLSENAAYHDAREEQGFIEGRILELESLVKNSEIVDTSAVNKDCIQIGNRVKVDFNGDKKEFEIVGAPEADPINGFISYNSPLGDSLLNKRQGDEFEFQAPKGKIKCKILEIK
ncbi:MAG: transcription elongation factor GreA [Patescibacteria group bacterium]|nr:transcription elongation factor GreA [Patescibacteria group bacterium]